MTFIYRIFAVLYMKNRGRKKDTPAFAFKRKLNVNKKSIAQYF